MKPNSLFLLMSALSLTIMMVWPMAFAQTLPHTPLIVVEDKGGASALPYYQALGLLADKSAQSPALSQQSTLRDLSRRDDSAMLPVRSVRLTPGKVQPRAIAAPGLRPLFLVGDDEMSRTWLAQRLDALKRMNAVGLVVNVDTAEDLQTLRALAPGLTLAPVSGDDIGRRLNLQHYPVLITPTSIEQ